MSSSFPFFSFTSLAFLLKALIIGPTTGSLWFTFLIWTVRLVTLAIAFRTILGPSILRLLFKRIRARSVSLRSIRGITFRSPAGIWRIDRIGLSYHRPSGRNCSRFAVKVEGVKVELLSAVEKREGTSSGTETPSHAAKSTLIPRSGSFTIFLRSLYDYAYSSLDPHVRPIVRTVVVTAFRLVIRALPALVQAVSFELESAVITLSTEVDAKLSIATARADMNVALEHLGSATIPQPLQSARHKRFASVANLNTRLKSSLKRTWDRAWGGTEVVASVCLSMSRIVVVTRDTTRDHTATTIAGMCCVRLQYLSYLCSS